MKKLALVCHRSAKLSFVFEAAEAAGIELVLIYDTTENAPAHLPAVTSTWQLPVFDEPQVALEAFAAGAQERGIGGVMTVREEAIIWTALAAQKIGTPGIDPHVAALARNKYLMRQAFAEAGLRSPRFCYIDNPHDLSQTRALGLPLVIKPLSGWSSTGVMLAKTAEELPALVNAVWEVQSKDLARFYDQDKAAGLVVEQYLPGKEFVVECFVDIEGVHVLAVGDKGQPEGPWFEETIYRQRRDIDDPLIMALCETARAGVKALGITMGAAHVELRLDAKEQAYVIEIGARIGGSGVSHFVVEQSTGVSFAALCMQAALGLPTPALPDVLPAAKVAANYIIPLRGDGRFNGFSGLEKVEEHPETARIVTFFEAGHLSPPPPAFGGYPGFIFSVHASDEAANAYHQWLDAALSINWNQ
jgi:biotin carboxylase